MNLACPHCQGLIASDPNLAGQLASCPFCAKQFLMPEMAPGTPVAAEAEPVTPPPSPEPPAKVSAEKLSPQPDMRQVFKLVSTITASGLRFWIGSKDRDTARQQLLDLVVQTEPEARPQIIEYLEKKALESGNPALWLLVLDVEGGRRKQDWPFYFHAIQSKHEGLHEAACTRLFDVIMNSADSATASASDDAELLAGLEASLRQGGGFYLCYLLIRLAVNEHVQDADLSIGQTQQRLKTFLAEETVVKNALRRGENPEAALAAFRGKKPHRPRKPEGRLCLGAKELLRRIQTGRFGDALQTELAETFEQVRSAEEESKEA